VLQQKVHTRVLHPGVGHDDSIHPAAAKQALVNIQLCFILRHRQQQILVLALQALAQAVGHVQELGVAQVFNCGGVDDADGVRIAPHQPARACVGPVAHGVRHLLHTGAGERIDIGVPVQCPADRGSGQPQCLGQLLDAHACLRECSWFVWARV
jgi:hypothetical protein